MRAQLLEVFGERDAATRRTAIERTYTDDITLIDAEESVSGYDALDAKVQALLDSGAPDFAFSVDGPVYVVADMGYLTWSLGPVGGAPVVRGSDTSFARDGRIARTYTILFV